MNCNRKYLHSKNLCCQTWNFCIYHRIFGYKSKTKNVTCGFILQYARLKAITCTIFYNTNEECDNNGVESDIDRFHGVVPRELPVLKR